MQRYRWFVVLSVATLVFGPQSCSAQPAPASHSLRAVVLSGGWAGRSAQLAAGYASALRAAGFEARILDPDALAAQGSLEDAGASLLVIPQAQVFPGSALAELDRYLRAGGHLIVLGAPAFDRLVRRVGSEWLDADQVQRRAAAAPASQSIVEIGAQPASAWMRSTNTPANPTHWEIVDEGPGHGPALHVTISDLEGWDTLTSPSLAAVPKPGENLIIFRAKGGPKTTSLAVEVREKDNSRWIATVPLTTEWRRYALDAGAFHLWDPDHTSGRQNTRLNLQNIASLTVGLAFTHTSLPAGSHEYWFKDVGSGFFDVGPQYDAPVYDTVSPAYKCYPIRDARSLDDWAGRVLLGQKAPPGLPRELLSTHPRASGAGFDKGRGWRWIPLIQVLGSDGSVRGTLATLLCHHGDAFAWGRWASFTVADDQWYARADVQRYVAALARRMVTGPLLMEGGSNWFGVFPDESLILGARVAGPAFSRCRVRVGIKPEGSSRPFYWHTLRLMQGQAQAAGSVKVAPLGRRWRAYLVKAELIQDGRVVDAIQHEVTVRLPHPHPLFMTSHDTMFWLGRRPWFPHGVNYMPSSGIAMEDGSYFENWMGPRAYDPAVIERDLRRVAAIGFNMVSVFMYGDVAGDHNLVDFLNRCEAHGLKVNLSLRPGTPLDFKWDVIRPIITLNRLASDDTVFAYDLAWEPAWGNYAARKRWDPQWQSWLLRKYGSIEHAQQVLGEAIPTADGRITSPGDDDVRASSRIPHVVAAYRHFLDDLLDRTHMEARRLIRTVDAHHLLSFRMSIAGDPTADPASMGYDFTGLARSMDFMAPEGYGHIGDWNRVRDGWFTVAYAHLTAPGRPVMWAEFGYTSWNPGAATPAPKSAPFAERFDRRFYPPQTVQFIERFYSDFYRMVLKSGSNGSVCWWYPGGFRYGENSDFGIINPDGTWRGVTRVINRYAPAIRNRRKLPVPDAWITVDRDAHPDGIYGIYNACKDQFWKLVQDGHYPGLKSARPIHRNNASEGPKPGGTFARR
ncbi:MAG: hypothetical protein ACP5VE_14650 [Chthonomonadales bacterium]